MGILVCVGESGREEDGQWGEGENQPGGGQDRIMKLDCQRIGQNSRRPRPRKNNGKATPAAFSRGASQVPAQSLSAPSLPPSKPPHPSRGRSLRESVVPGWVSTSAAKLASVVKQRSKRLRRP